MKASNLSLIILLIFFGAANTLFLKFQNIQTFKSSPFNTHFFHPFIQTSLMFLGEMLCGFIYLCSRKAAEKQQTYGLFQKDKAPVLLLFIPAVLDLMASLLSYIALNMVASSVWQISRGGVIITTAIFSALVLKKKLQTHSIVGCSIAFLGITGVQIITIVQADRSGSAGGSDSEVLGVVLLLSSLVFNGAGLVSEKWIFNNYELSPLKLVFWEGVYGFVVMLGLSVGGQFVSCPWNNVEQNCVYIEGDYYVESWNVFIEQCSDNMLVWIFGLCLVVSISISVPIAVTISKRINPLSRSLADVCRTLIIWAVGIVVTLTIGEKTNTKYKIEDTDVLTNILKGICFCILIVGTMIYHEMLPCVNFKKDQKQSLLLSDSDDDNLFESPNLKLDSAAKSISSKSSRSSSGKKSAGSTPRKAEPLL